MASITERAQRMEKDLRETNAKHDRSAAELQVRREDVHTYGVRMCGLRGDTQAVCARRTLKKPELFNIRVSYD